MTCKDCLHYEVCVNMLSPFEFDERMLCDKFFTNKSEWVHLPCKVGDTIYFDTYRRGESIGVQPHKVERIEVLVSIERRFGSVGAQIPDWHFGKYVFLTKEEAEKALEERSKNNERG